VIIRNQSLQEKYPGGLEAFIQDYKAQNNDRISVYNDMGLDVGELMAVIENMAVDNARISRCSIPWKARCGVTSNPKCGESRFQWIPVWNG
jgi:hypothetical protein